MSSRITFLDLPREIRDIIFKYGLSTPWPIVIYAKDPYDYYPGVWIEENNPSGWASRLRVAKSMATGLFLTNSQISCEAARVCYSLNTFAFAKDKNWSSLWHFLHHIGDENRACLRNLVVHLGHIETGYQLADGTLLEREPHPWFLKPYHVLPQELHLPLDPSAPIVAGHVDLLDPAMRACFRKLANRDSKLKLTIELGDCYLTGLCFSQNPLTTTSQPGTYTAEILEYFAAEETQGKVDVIWQGVWHFYNWAGWSRKAEEAGYEIVEAYEMKNGSPTNRVPDVVMHFELRWRGTSVVGG